MTDRPDDPLSDPPPLASPDPEPAPSPDRGSEEPDEGSKRLDLQAIRQKLAENPGLLRAVIGVAVMLVLLLVLAIVWLGGGEEPKRARRRVAPPPPAPPVTASDRQTARDEVDSAGADQEGTPGRDASGEPGADEGDSDAVEGQDEDQSEEEEPEAPPPLPEDVSAWNRDDYFRARREESPLLVEAVRHLGEQFVGNENVARGLAALLPPPESDEDDAAKRRTPLRRRSRVDQDDPVTAIIDALAQNNTEAAHAALSGVLSGETTMAQPEAAVEATLLALATHPGPGNDVLLLRVLVEPAQLREVAEGAPAAAGRGRGRRQAGPLTAQGLQQQALEVVRQDGGAGVRTRLARVLAQPTMTRDWRDRLGEFLLDEDPRNLGAQFVMYQAADLRPEKRERIETFFAQCGSRAIGEMLHLPEAPRQRRRSEMTGPEALQCASQIWGPKATSVFIKRLEAVESLEKRASLVNLCATMPVESVRRALRAALRPHDDQGSGVFGKSGRDRLMTDPALLLSIKSLPRAVAAPDDRNQGRGRRGDSWLDFTETLVLDWCERLRSAAARQAEAARLAGNNPEEAWALDRLPFEPHEGARVKSAYAVTWPEMLPKQLSGAPVAPTRIQYVRIEQRETRRRMKGYYRLKTRQRDGQDVPGGVWFGTYRAGQTPEQRVSIDVLITGADRRTARDSDPTTEENLVIELLVVEAADPAG